MKLSKETEQKINELQHLEQNMQALLLQRQNFQSQLNEISSALEELGKTEKSYKIVGNIMVLRKKEELSADLESKKEMMQMRIKALEKQEEKLKSKVTEIQSAVMGEINAAEGK